MTETKVTGCGRHRADGTGGSMPVVEQRIVTDPALDYCPGHQSPGITEPWFCAGPGLCRSGRESYAAAQSADAVTQQFDAVTEQTALVPVDGTLDAPFIEPLEVDEDDEPIKFAHDERAVPAPSWLTVVLVVIGRELDNLVNRVAYRITRFVIEHARGMAWFVVLAPAVAAVLVFGAVGALAVLR